MEQDSLGNVKADQYVPGPKTRKNHGDSFAAPAPPAAVPEKPPAAVPEKPAAE